MEEKRREEKRRKKRTRQNIGTYVYCRAAPRRANKRRRVYSTTTTTTATLLLVLVVVVVLVRSVARVPSRVEWETAKCELIDTAAAAGDACPNPSPSAYSNSPTLDSSRARDSRADSAGLQNNTNPKVRAPATGHRALARLNVRVRVCVRVRVRVRRNREIRTRSH